MDIWGLLGISPTMDIARIKEAYARQAKLHHPEEHPEEFKALQNAYKAALRMAKCQKAAVSYVMPENISRREPEAKPPEAVLGREPEKEETKVIPELGVEHSFDFSNIDSYGDKERFFNQFLLITENPYLCNNLDAWDYFLNRKEFVKLFDSTGFRMNLVRTMCGRPGWRRKTILFFEKYLAQFHTEENKPADGKWETELPCFRIRRLPWLRLPAFCTDRFFGKKGAVFHKKLRSKISSSQGREISLDIRSDVIMYLKLYLSYGESNEDYIEHLHEEWVTWKTMLNGVAFVICFFLILAWIHSRSS